MAVASVDVPPLQSSPVSSLQFTVYILDRLSRNESSPAVTAATGAGAAAPGGETTAPSRGRAPSWLAGCTSRQRAARQMVGNSVVYPHLIGGTRDAGDGSCCAGCQECCCRATTHRGGDVRRLASDGEEVGRSWLCCLSSSSSYAGTLGRCATAGLQRRGGGRRRPTSLYDEAGDTVRAMSQRRCGPWRRCNSRRTF